MAARAVSEPTPRELFAPHVLSFLGYLGHNKELDLDDMSPTLFLVSREGEPQIVDVSPAMHNEHSKKLFVEQMREAAAAGEFVTSALAMGAWLSTQSKEEVGAGGMVRPSQDPQRQSVVIVSIEDPVGVDISVYTFDPQTRSLLPYRPFDEDGAPAQLQSRFIWFPHNVAAQAALDAQFQAPQLAFSAPDTRMNA